jgi:hypothetical protein
MEKIQAQADEWGAEVIKFELSDCTPNDTTARLIQTKAAATFKLHALDDAAKQLGLKGAGSIPPILAAVLVGAPLVASVGDDSNRYETVQDKEDEDNEHDHEHEH